MEIRHEMIAPYWKNIRKCWVFGSIFGLNWCCAPFVFIPFRLNLPPGAAGATGYVGSRVCLELLKKGYTVHAPVRNIARAADLKALGGNINLFEVADIITVRPPSHFRLTSLGLFMLFLFRV
jgi:hypothetical protein